MNRTAQLGTIGMVAMLAVLVVHPALAQPRLIPFQARLTDSGGGPFNGESRITFAIYEVATGGTPLNGWVETHDNVSISDGLIDVLLGGLTSLDDPDGDGTTDDAISFAFPRYLGIKVGSIGNQEMVPRRQLVPHFHANVADTAVEGGIGTEQLAAGAVTGAKIDRKVLTPPGVIVPFSGATAPPGWVICDGAEYDGTDPAYAGLFTAIGTSFGGSGNVFNVPDLRGRFLRGVDAGAGTDPDATDRTGGDAVGSTQDVSTIAAQASGVTNTAGVHSHPMLLDDRTEDPFVFVDQSNSVGVLPALNGPGRQDPEKCGQDSDIDGGLCDETLSAGSHSHSVSVTAAPPAGASSTEVRPANIALTYICKL